MPLIVRARVLLLIQVLVLAVGCVLMGQPLMAPVSIALSGVLVLELRRRAIEIPQLLPRDAIESGLVAELNETVRALSHQAGLRRVPKVSLTIGETPPHVVRTGRPRILVGTVLLADVAAGRFARRELEALLAHEVAHLTDPAGPLGEVISYAGRLAVLIVMLAALLSSAVGSDTATALTVFASIGTVVIGNLVGGARRRVDELLADERAAALMGSSGPHRMATGLRRYTARQISAFVDAVLRLGKPAQAAAVRDSIAEDYHALEGDQELAGRYEAMVELARRHRRGIGAMIGDLVADVRHLALSGGSSHPALATRLRRLRAIEASK